MPQSVFDVQTSRGVLIVSPIGDAVGFRDADVNSSIEQVVEQIRDGAPPLVVADLGANNYFGSVMIGALVQFAEQAVGAGGAFVVCNASDDMQAVFKVMRLHEKWTICDSRREAIRLVRQAAS